ncbi:MAG: PAS domain-containing protein [Bdellovibrio sp.]
MEKIDSKSLLERQLKKQGLSLFKPPDSAEAWREFLGQVLKAYEEYNEALMSSDKTLEISLNEMEQSQREIAERSSDQLKRCLNAVKMGVWEWDMRTNSLYWDASMYELYGMNPKKYSGAFAAWESSLHPEDKEKYLEISQDAIMRKNHQFKMQFRIVRPDGGKLYIDATCHIQYNIDGTPIKMSGVNYDASYQVEARKLREKNMIMKQFLYNVDRAVVITESRENLLHNIVNAVIQGRQWAVSSFYVFDTEIKKCRLTEIGSSDPERFHEFIKASKRIMFEPGEGLPGRVQVSLKPTLISSLTNDDGFLRAPYAKKLGLRSGLGIPIFCEDSFYGVLEVFSEDTIETLKLIESEVSEVSIRIGNALDKLAVQQKLKDSENCLREEKMKFEELVKGLNQVAIVAITDLSGTITSVNDRFCDISGYSREELIGANHRILNSNFHTQDFFNNLWRTISKGGQWRGEICNRRKNGTLYWVDTSITRILSPDGSSQYMAIRYDISARKESEAKLIHSSKLASLGEMAGGIAHEINNPLGIAQGKAKQLLRMIGKGKFTSEHAMEELGKIIETTERIAKIVKGLRSFSRNADKDPFVPIELNTLMNNVLGLCSERFKVHGVRLEIVPIAELILHCRSVQLEQVLVNLLNNAYDAVESLQEKWVHIDFRILEEKIQILVTDSGNGIPPHIVNKLMHPFFTTKDVGRGTGLGLSISKGIIEDHQGQLWYDPSCPHTRFVIELPMAQKVDKNIAI